MLSHRLVTGKKDPLEGPETLAIRQPKVVAQWWTVGLGLRHKHQQKQGLVQIPAQNLKMQVRAAIKSTFSDWQISA